MPSHSFPVLRFPCVDNVLCSSFVQLLCFVVKYKIKTGETQSASKLSVPSMFDQLRTLVCGLRRHKHKAFVNMKLNHTLLGGIELPRSNSKKYDKPMMRLRRNAMRWFSKCWEPFFHDCRRVQISWSRRGRQFNLSFS